VRRLALWYSLRSTIRDLRPEHMEAVHTPKLANAEACSMSSLSELLDLSNVRHETLNIDHGASLING
jgi:hypothetical protein